MTEATKLPRVSKVGRALLVNLHKQNGACIDQYYRKDYARLVALGLATDRKLAMSWLYELTELGRAVVLGAHR